MATSQGTERPGLDRLGTAGHGLAWRGMGTTDGVSTPPVDTRAIGHGIVDTATKAATDAVRTVLAALDVTLTPDDEDMVGLAITAGLMAGVDAHAAALRAAGRDVPDPGALATWLAQVAARTEQAT